MTQHNPKPSVREVIPIMHAYRDKPGNGDGGSLHNVLADGNVDDDSVRFCRDRAADKGETDGVALSELLLNMSKTQRKALAGKFHGGS
jgi:hypothetical protein